MSWRVLDETLHIYVAPFGAVMMYDQLFCMIFVITAGYHRLLGSVLHITWVPIGRRFLIACTWFLLVGL